MCFNQTAFLLIRVQLVLHQIEHSAVRLLQLVRQQLVTKPLNSNLIRNKFNFS